MKALGNILRHFPFLGLLSAVGAFLLGRLLVITITALPIGRGLIELSKFYLAPFSHAMISKYELQSGNSKIWKRYDWIVRIIYFPIGFLLSILVTIQIAVAFITIIGIPVALVSAKSLSTIFNPVNKECVPTAVADEVERKKDRKR